MTLKDLRQSKGLTQKEAARFVGMPLRTYQRYEKSAEYEHTIKYRYVCQRLEKHGFVDEEHGVLTMDQIGKACVQVCVEYSVQYCWLFGSYATGQATARSDVDLVVSADEHGCRYCGIEDTFRESLKKRVDLMYPDQIKGREDIICSILQDGVLLYRSAGAGGAA